MKFVENEIAKDLYHDLVLRIEGFAQDAEVSISGRGSQAKCIARHGILNCTMHCFINEYLTYFRRDDEVIAAGRSKLTADIIDAVVSWLQGADLKELHERFPFVDRNKRAHESLRDEMTALFPDLEASAPSEVKVWRGDICDLQFIGATRSIRISLSRDNASLEASYCWDDCELFNLVTHDRAYLAGVANRWLCDLAMPSEMRAGFPEIEIGYLADYYEQGNPVEGEFLQSWDDVEATYRKPGPDYSPNNLKLILQMREHGYDRLLRAGFSMDIFIISRSRRNGLRYDHPHITFSFRGDAIIAYICDIAGKKKIRIPTMEFTQEVEALLKLMASSSVD